MLWIPAFAGMTPVRLKAKFGYCHSRVGGKVYDKLHETKGRERSVNPVNSILTAI